MRLIDANELKKAIKEWGIKNFYLEDVEYLEAIIDNQPTAYNIDAVVEQLEEESYGFEGLEYIDLDKAIEIVKGENNG